MGWDGLAGPSDLVQQWWLLQSVACFPRDFFLGAGAGTCPFTLRYSRHCLLLARWLPWQLAHFLITVLPDCMA